MSKYMDEIEKILESDEFDFDNIDSLLESGTEVEEGASEEENEDVNSIDEEYEDVADAEFPYEPTNEGAAAISTMLEESYMNIIKENGMDELAYMLQNHEAMPIEEAFDGLNGIKTKAIAAFKAFLNKVKVMVGKFIVGLNGLVRSDKAFIKAYAGRIRLGSAYADSTKFSGYNYTIDGVMDKVANNLSSITTSTSASTAEDYSKEAADRASMIRAKAVGSNTDLSSAALSKELFKMLRSGAESKVDVKINAADVIKQLETAEADKKAANASYKKIKEVVDKTISGIKAYKATSKEDAKRIDTLIKDVKIALTVLSTTNGAVLSAIKGRNRQNKAIAVKLAQYQISRSKTPVKAAASDMKHGSTVVKNEKKAASDAKKAEADKKKAEKKVTKESTLPLFI